MCRQLVPKNLGSPKKHRYGLIFFVLENGDGDGVVTSHKDYGQLAGRVVDVLCQQLVAISGESLQSVIII